MRPASFEGESTPSGTAPDCVLASRLEVAEQTGGDFTCLEDVDDLGNPSPEDLTVIESRIGDIHVGGARLVVLDPPCATADCEGANLFVAGTMPQADGRFPARCVRCGIVRSFNSVEERSSWP
jgi:hypothetical protein